MPLEITVVEPLILVRVFGTIASAEFFDYIDEITRIEAATPVTWNRITDISGSDPTLVPSTTIMQLAAIRSKAQIKNPIRSAIVAILPLQIGLSRMFQILNEHPDIHVEIFQKREEAWAWLEGGPDPLRHWQRTPSPAQPGD